MRPSRDGSAKTARRATRRTKCRRPGGAACRAGPGYRSPAVAVLGAVGDRRIVVAGLGGTAIAFHVHRPGVVAVPGEELHRRRIWPPGTSRSKVGCEAIEEPWTNRIVALALAGSPAHLFHMKSFTSPLLVQCSLPVRRCCRVVSFMDRPFTIVPHGGVFVRRLRTCPTRPCAMSKGLARAAFRIGGGRSGARPRPPPSCRHHCVRRKAYGRGAVEGMKIATRERSPTSACLTCCTALSLGRFPPWNRSRFAYSGGVCSGRAGPGGSGGPGTGPQERVKMNALLQEYLPLVIFIGVSAVIGAALLIAPFIVAYASRTRKSSRPMSAASTRSTTPA